ncbi:hypothetical protein Tco_0449445 [Tanacetum coccineum]
MINKLRRRNLNTFVGGTTTFAIFPSDKSGNNANISGNMMKDAESRKEVSNPNPFDVLNSAENDVDLGTNGGTSNLASKEANSNGSSFWNVRSSSNTTTPIVEKFDKLERQIIDGKLTLEQWRETYENADYEYDPYDDDMYEGQEIPDNIQSICDNLDIKLISSVLAFMQTYWASVYLLPETVVKKIDKAQGPSGLGIKPLGEWNEVLLMKNIWKTLGWKKLMELRSKIKPHVFYNIGNGKTTSEWYDRWNLCGLLSNIITRRDIYDARFNDSDCVADLIEDRRWKWPSEWFENFHVLKSIDVPSLKDKHDQTVWLNNNGKLMKFTIRDVWMDMRSQ